MSRTSHALVAPFVGVSRSANWQMFAELELRNICMRLPVLRFPLVSPLAPSTV